MKSFEYTITDPVGIHVKVTVEGADEDTAAAAIEEFFKANL